MSSPIRNGFQNHEITALALPSGSLDRLTRNRRSARLFMRIELFLIVGVIGGFFAWAALAHISGAVMAIGVVRVEEGVKKIQHPTGGIIDEVRVKEGDAVSSGDVLARLDAKTASAEWAIYDDQWKAMVARKARLMAERDGQDIAELAIRRAVGEGNPVDDTIVQGEIRLSEARRAALLSQKQVLDERKNQLGSERSGNLVQIETKQKESELLQLELKGVEDLYAANLASVARVMPLRRELARTQGDFKVLTTQLAQLDGKMSEIDLQMVSLDRDRSSEVNRDLQEIEPKIKELENRMTIARALVEHADIRAPVSGYVHQLNIHTVGGVVQSGDVLMQIVPRDSLLTIEASVAPSDIDQVHTGGQATLRLTAFNRRVTPELNGVVSSIAADAVRDERTGQSSYPIKISVPDTELTKLSGAVILPGMNAEIYIETVERSVLSYLLKPALDQFAKVFREK